MIELLAPAKNKICAKAAIDYGADAIYIGASEFGARRNVPNSLADIEEIVQYAHKFNVKVYVTINTILTDDEILQAKELIEKLHKIGVDAVIIQDMGLLEPSPLGGEGRVRGFIPIHASTQCDNRTAEKVKFLENVGFSRVILARELSLEKIKEIKSQTNIELEAFIHGALCVSYSGQCYLSQMIGGKMGRSANRGECAQPCRKKYSLVDEDGKFIEKDKYLLCLKDFNASKHIKALAEAGVTSFKIEGRLKDENYVKNVVAYYRKLIDDLGFQKTSSGQIIFDFEPNLEKSFNRGFTDYFLEKRGECYTFDSPKSKGEYLGKVSKIAKDYFEIMLSSRYARPTAELHPQDGLCFYINNELFGCLVNKCESRSGIPARQQQVYPNKMDGIKVGTEIYRNFDSEFDKKLKTSKTCRKIGINIEFDLGKIKAIDENKNSAEISYKFDEFAQNEEKMGVNLINQLKKSGDTDFLVKEVNILTQKIPFLPVSKLNELRRELLEKLMQERLKNHKITPHPALSPKGRGEETFYPQSKIDYRGNILNKYAKSFYEKHGYKITEMALESGGKCIGKTAMTCRHCLKYAFNMCKSPKTLYLIDEKGKRYPLKFNCENGSNLCEMEIIF
jgi:23S rRNA 5-hydroxycytidine C2501 synthase